MKPKEQEKKESDQPTFFEMQYDAWMHNDCQGNIEDYDGTEY